MADKNSVAATKVLKGLGCIESLRYAQEARLMRRMVKKANFDPEVKLELLTSIARHKRARQTGAGLVIGQKIITRLKKLSGKLESGWLLDLKL